MIEPTATSIDGRQFGCETPVETALPPGSFVAIETGDGRTYLGRMLESEILELRPSRSRPHRGMVTVRSETRDQFGEVVQVLVAKLVVPRRMQPVPSKES